MRPNAALPGPFGVLKDKGVPGRVPKRWSHLYPQIYDFANLYEAYREARRGRRYQADVLRFSYDLEGNLIQLQNELIWRRYEVGRYREFLVYDPKRRIIMALPFRDRVVQWAIYRVLNPLLDRTYIYDSYACRVGKGTHAAVDRLQEWMKYLTRRHGRVYALHLDIRKYFYRVDHDVLKGILRRRIKDKDLLWLLDTIIDSNGDRFGLPLDSSIDDLDGPRLAGIGMPIGNLTSQMFANLYLNEADHYAKERLRIKHYIRYMDDILILSPSKRELRIVKDELTDFLEGRLRLSVSAKTSIRPVDLGVEWVGYRVWPTHRLVKRATKQKIKRRLRHLQHLYAAGLIDYEGVRATVHSYLGYLKHCNSRNLTRQLIEAAVFVRGGVADEPRPHEWPDQCA